MKKILALVLLAILLITVAMSGCNSSASSSSRPTASSSRSSTPAASTPAASTPAAAPEMVFRYAENQSADYPTTLGAYRFAELVKEKTNGRITIEVYHGAQLGDEKSVMEQMQFGAVDFARVSLSPLAEFSPSLNVLQMPYLYRDGAHMWKVLEGEIGDTFLTSIEGSGLLGLSWYDSGARSFYTTKKEVKTLEDLKGMNIRVQESALAMGMINALGANPTPMAYGEVYSALQTGVIAGAENNWPSYESTSHYEVAPYYLVDEHTRVPEMQIISKMTWDKLSGEDKAIISESAKESALYQREEWAKRETASQEKVRAAGCTINTLSPEEKQKFQDACKPLYEEFAKDHMDIVNKILETK